MDFSKKLLTLRKNAGLSQEELAEKLGVSRQAISRWEVGSVMPDAENLLQISDLFNVSVDYLLRNDVSPTGDKSAASKGSAESAQKENNRRSAFVALIFLQVLALFWGVLGLHIFKNTLIVVFAITMQIVGIAAFEIGYRKYGTADSDAKRWRMKYYRTAIWLITYIPVRALVAPGLQLVIGAFPSLLYEVLSIALTVVLCAAITHKLNASH